MKDILKGFIVLVCVMLLGGTAIAEGTEPDATEFDVNTLYQALGLTYPELPETPQIGQWYTVYPEGAICADGSPWHGLIRLGSENKLMVFFYGGGVSLNGETSRNTPEWFYFPTVALQDLVVQGGIFQAIDENSFKDWTILAVEYASGDFHCGTGEYHYTDENGDEQTVYHHGYTNYSLFMDRVKPYIGEPDTLVVTGSSAGGFATALLTDDVMRRVPSATNVIACVDSALLLYDDWQETARELWQAPEEICSKLTGDNIVLDSLVDLQSKHSDVKILFTCSVRDHDLQRYQAYIRDGSMESNPENSALFQQDLNAFVIQMQKDLSNPGFYIWEYGQQPDGSTQHMIWPSNPFDRLSDDVTAAEWLDRAVQGEILSCGLDLLQ